MSLSELVDEGYRLDAADLQGRQNQVVISNVSYQGVEEINYVLHFEGILKRLTLNHEQWRQLAETTGSIESRDWIGAKVVVAPQTEAGVTSIAILPATRPTRRLRMRRAESTVDWRGWIIAGAIVTAVIALSTLYLQWQGSQLSPLIEQFLH